jgi:hypothetical protein
MTSFARRHIGPSESDQRKMLAECGFGTIVNSSTPQFPLRFGRRGQRFPALFPSPMRR